MTMQTFQSTSSRQIGASQHYSEHLISDNLKLVEILVRQLAKTLPLRTDVDDLRQAGFVGLIEAARNFDADRGIQFDTFASSRVRGAMVDELRSRVWAPRSMSARLRSIAETTRQLEQKAGRSITLTEVADALNTTVGDIDRTRSDSARANLQSLNALESDDIKSIKMLGSVCTPAEDLENIEFRTALSDAVGTLNVRQKSVITLRYSEGATQAEISEQFDLTASRVCQIEASAMAHLRSQLDIRPHGAPVCDLKVRPIIENPVRTAPLPHFTPLSGRRAVVGPAGFLPTGGMRYLLETIPKAKSHRSSLKRASAFSSVTKVSQVG